jgi:hypothetical protein
VRTTKKEFKEVIQKHVIDCLIEVDEIKSQYDILVNEVNPLETQLQLVMDGFNDWYKGHEQKRNPSRIGGFKDWLLGLPSAFSIEYRHYWIDELIKGWFASVGEQYKEPKDDSKTYELYYHLVIREFRGLCEKNGVDFW